MAENTRCRRCKHVRPPEHFALPGHEPTSDHLRRTPVERWLAKVERGGDGCWLWVGAKHPLGYGNFWLEGKYVAAHRAGYLLLIGQIPDEAELDHLCRTPSCVRPDHLEPVSHLENVRRGVAGEVNGGRGRAKTRCPQGHPYDEENTSVRPQGWRRCKACARDYYHRKKDAHVLVTPGEGGAADS